MRRWFEGEYQKPLSSPISCGGGPSLTVCPLAQPEIAVGPESQIELWLALTTQTGLEGREDDATAVSADGEQTSEIRLRRLAIASRGLFVDVHPGVTPEPVTRPPGLAPFLSGSPVRRSGKSDRGDSTGRLLRRSPFLGHPGRFQSPADDPNLRSPVTHGSGCSLQATHEGLDASNNSRRQPRGKFVLDISFHRTPACSRRRLMRS